MGPGEQVVRDAARLCIRAAERLDATVLDSELARRRTAYERDLISLHISAPALHLLRSAWQRCQAIKLSQRRDGSYDLELTENLDRRRLREFGDLVRSIGR